MPKIHIKNQLNEFEILAGPNPEQGQKPIEEILPGLDDELPDPPFEHDPRTYTCPWNDCIHSCHTGKGQDGGCDAEDQLPDADYSNDPDDDLCPLYKERPDTWESVLDQIVNGPDPTPAEEEAAKAKFLEDIERIGKSKEQQWPASCKNCPIESCDGCPNVKDEPGTPVAVPVQRAPVAGPGYSLVPIGIIYPNPANPRKRIDEESLAQLTESIRQVGILEPLLVAPSAETPEDRRWRIVAGERRWRAAIAAGLQEAPVIVRELTPDQEFEVMLTENIQRADLDPIEEAQAFRAAIDRGWNQGRLAEKLGISQAQVANRLRLLKLPESIQENISREIMAPSQALMLVKVAHRPEMIERLTKELAGVPVASSEDIIDRQIRYNFGKPLYHINDWNAPQFDPDKVGCGKCEDRVEVKDTPDAKKRHPYCLNRKCWGRHNQEVQQAHLQEKIEAAFPGGDAPADLPSVRDLTNWTSPGGGCDPSCEHIRPALGYGGTDVVKICMNPDCKIERQAKAQQERKEQAQQEQLAWAAEKTRLVELAEAAGASGPERSGDMPLVYMAAKAIEMADDAYYCQDDDVYSIVYRRFGWEEPTEEEADGEEERLAHLVDRLMGLPGHDLLQAIFIALLAPAPSDDTVYRLTLGAGDGDGEDGGRG